MKKVLLAFAVLSLNCAYAQDSLGVSKLGQVTYTEILNDIWGYATATNEYALVGVMSGFSIVDVTNPSAPVKKHFIPGVFTTWRDIKTWGHYAYVVHDGAGAGNSDGIRIVDLNTIDSATISYSSFFPTVTIGGNSFTYHDAHNIYIDENGVLYLFGSNLGGGGAAMFDVATNPTAPTFLGAYDGNYFHDGVARGDTLWGAAINAGTFEVINVQNKANPVFMASQATPNNFTHNIWFSDDNQTVYTTDERKGSYVTAYDVSDLSNITELDRIQTSIFPGSEVIPHNTHVKGNFLVTSYYTSGLQIVDATFPDILVETAYYDTSPASGDGYDGAWGAYPYLPSGIVLVTDRQEGLFILDTDYPGASFFTVFVKDSVTGNPIINSKITMVGSDIEGFTNIFGNFRDGQRDSGNYLVVVEKTGYYTDTLHIKMEQGVVRSRTVALLPIGFSIGENHLMANDIYPNPGTDNINIKLSHIEDPIVQINIYDLSGKLMLSKEQEVGQAILHVDHQLPYGIYVVKLSSANVEYNAQRIVVAPQH